MEQFEHREQLEGSIKMNDFEFRVTTRKKKRFSSILGSGYVKQGR